jgi:hypothetical protein
MKNFEPAKLDSRTEERVQRIVDLSRRRDQILFTADLDLEALRILAADYEAANMLSMATELWKRMEHYQERGT